MSDAARTDTDADVAARRGLPWVAVILAGGLISYTVSRLSHLSDHRPYDPGPAYPIVDVAAEDATSELDALRQAFLDRRSVRREGEAERTLSCWPLDGIERERALLLQTLRHWLRVL